MGDADGVESPVGVADGVESPVGDAEGGSGGEDIDVRDESVSHETRYEYVHPSNAFLHLMWTHTTYEL